MLNQAGNQPLGEGLNELGNYTVMVSKYITGTEFQCACCGELPPDFDIYPYEEFFDVFDNIREEWGKPININSGYRCPVHNASLPGSSPISAHMSGLALDCACPGEVEELHSLIVRLHPELRIGKYSTFIHIDQAFKIYPRGSIHWVEGARW